MTTNFYFHQSSYLWAVGEGTRQMPVGEVVGDRYEVIAPQIWQDLRHGEGLDHPIEITPDLRTYLQLFDQHCHLPQLYDVIHRDGQRVLLLSQAPINVQGELFPSLRHGWGEASALRQLHWLWQILELWPVLWEQGVAASLLVPDNLRVEGWRLGLCQLVFAADPQDFTLEDLGESWRYLVAQAQPLLQEPLGELVAAMATPEMEIAPVRELLNTLLLEEAAKNRLKVSVASGSEAGYGIDHNEDSYYPMEPDIISPPSNPHYPLDEHWAMVCDGIAGHEAGEVASQLAVFTGKQMASGLLLALQEDSDRLLLPERVAEQIAELIRMSNNAIFQRNQEQNRQGRRRMATTVVMGLQFPQKVTELEDGVGNSHELYVANVGDSRAYWLTASSCQRLTVDHDLATKEVLKGRALYRQAQRLKNSGSLSMALGMVPGEQLPIRIQRLMIDEDGVLLICSDGLSDRNFIERNWPQVIPDVLDHRITIQEAVQRFLNLAKQEQVKDNITLVLTHYEVTEKPPVTLNIADMELPLAPAETMEAQLIDEPETPGGALSLAEPEAIASVETVPDWEAELMPAGLNLWKLLGLMAGILLLIGGATWAGFAIDQWLENRSDRQEQQ